jgi:molecular chaperone GrpE
VTESSSEFGGASDVGPASGGERPSAATAGGADRVSGEGSSPEPAADSAVGSPPQAGPQADRAAESGEPDPLVTAIRERDEFRDALVHLQADFENYKKRILKQQTEHLERAAESLVDKLLPVLDTADLALTHGGGEDVKQITVALASTLEREGLERIDPTGCPFDPTLHDAVAHEPSEGGEQEVVEVLRAGYRWKGRVLRPAMVKVRG